MVQAMSWLIMPGADRPDPRARRSAASIVTYLDWRWIFYLNLPIGIARRRPGRRASSPRCASETPQRVRLRSASCCRASSLGCLLFGFEMTSRTGEAGWRAIADRASARSSGVAYLRHAQRTAASDPRSVADADPDLPPVGDRRLADPHHAGRAAVPAAADAAARLRHVRGAERRDDRRRRRSARWR